MKKVLEFSQILLGLLPLKPIVAVLVAFAVMGSMTGCNPNGEDPDGPSKTPRTEVPDEIVGAWQDGYLDFDLWENYPEGHWAGRYAAPSREAMIFYKNGDAKFYRYEFARNLYEELIDCTGTVTFNGDGTFTFYPVKGRKRFHDFSHSENNKDRALTSSELTDPKLAGKRGYTYDGSSDPPSMLIKVPTSAPYYWYKKFD